MNAPQQQGGGTTSTRNYYFFNGQRIAMRQCSGTCSAANTGVVTWLHSDPLGSATLATNASGQSLAGSETRYAPFGTVRFGGAGLPNDRRFNGNTTDIAGLLDFGARAYDPLIGRFVSADTIVPNSADPQTLNRYVYGLNSPTNYTDPSGHDPWWNNDVQPIVDIYHYDISFNFESGFWTADSFARAMDEIDNLASNLKAACRDACDDMREDEVFRRTFGSIDFIAEGAAATGCNAGGAGTIVCGGKQISTLSKPSGRGLITHEVGHKFDRAIGHKGRTDIGNATIKDANDSYVTGVDPQTGKYRRTERQYRSDNWGDMQHPNRIGYSAGTTPQGEEFADMFMAWNLGLFNNNLPGQAAQAYMNALMPDYAALAVSDK